MPVWRFFSRGGENGGNCYDNNMRAKVLGLPVDLLMKDEAFLILKNWVSEKKIKPRMIVTAYSEFFVKASHDKDFARIIREADLVTPDGSSVLAAVAFNKATRSQITDHRSQIGRIFFCLWEGLKVGGMILSGKIGEPVTGVYLFEKITSEAERRNWRVFLLGGWNNVSAEAAGILLKRFPNIKVAYSAGEKSVGSDPETDKRVVKEIQNFNPDFLFVQYSPVVQEKWIDSHRAQLSKVGIAMGIGGTLDEYVGRLKTSPSWMERHGLKWLWRLILQPSRWHRMIDAVIVFPWLVFRESLR